MNARAAIFAGFLTTVFLFAGIVLSHRHSPPTSSVSTLRPAVDLDQAAASEEPYALKQSHANRQLYLEALKHAKLMPKYSTRLGTFVSATVSPSADSQPQAGTWIPLGPGNVGGRTRGLVIDPRNANVMYAAAASGGVWKTTDAGASWVPLTDSMPSLIMGCLAIDPSNPDTLYAGTGELSVGALGVGIYKTTDGGTTWTLLSDIFQPAPNGPPQQFGFVDAIVVSPNNSQRVYVATGFGGEDGVCRSSDGGNTWTQVLPGRRGGSLSSQQGCHSLVIRTDQDTDYIVANCSDGSSSGIYLNTGAEGSGTWSPVLEESSMGVVSLAIAPSNQNVMYALASGSFADQSLHAFFMSTDGGHTWGAQVRAGGTASINTELLSDACANTRSQGFYDNVIAVDPTDPNRVWAGGINLFRSDDAGATWNLADDGIHVDHHTLLFHPKYDGKSNVTMFGGNDGGVFATQQARGTTAQCNTSPRIRWTPQNSNYSTTQFYSGSISADGTAYAGGTQDNGYLLGNDTDGFSGWRQIWGGDGGVVAFDPTDSKTMYLRNNRPAQLLKSTDAGRSFNVILSGQLAGPYNSPILIDPSNPNRVWVASWGDLPALSRSIDAGASWTEAARLGPLDYGPVGAVAIAPSNPNLMLASIGGTGRLHRCDTALTSTIDTLWPENIIDLHSAITSIAFDPQDSNIAYLTNGAYRTPETHSVYKSTDSGLTWQGLDGSGSSALPNIPLTTILPDSTRPGTIYVGSPIGVFVTLDGGDTWAKESMGIDNVEIGTLSLTLADNIPRLYAFTYGRGVWRVRPVDFASHIIAASVTGKRLTVTGENFDSSAVILVNGSPLPTSAGQGNPGTVLTSKKGGKKIPHGQGVILQARNGDGTYSDQFQFVRP